MCPEANLTALWEACSQGQLWLGCQQVKAEEEHRGEGAGEEGKEDSCYEEPQAWKSELPRALPLYARCFQWQLGWVPWGSYFQGNGGKSLKS